MDRVTRNTMRHMRALLQKEATGHDWWHIYRVRGNALAIASKEKGADMQVVELAALLHDIKDWKFHDGDTTAGPQAAREWLERQKLPKQKIDRICKVIEEVTFKGAGVKTTPSTLEGKIVQDADRLDALGAIGIARAFAYGGNMGREMYNPELKPVMHRSFEQYKKSKGTTINHFYEKLLLLRGIMNTGTARRMARKRHRFMERYLDRFYKEWNGRL